MLQAVTLEGTCSHVKVPGFESDLQIQQNWTHFTEPDIKGKYRISMLKKELKTVT